MPTEKKQIISDDLDGLASEVTAEIWNKIVHQPAFHALQPAHFADLFEAVSLTLLRRRRMHTEAPKGVQ